MGDRSLGLLRGLAGQGDDLTDLLGGDPGRPPRPWGVGQPLFGAEFVQGERPEGHPAGAPEPDGVEGHAARLSDPGIAVALGGGQDDAGAEGDLLGRGMAPQEGVEGFALLVGEFNREGLGSAQGQVRKERKGCGSGCNSNGIISASQFSPAALVCRVGQRRGRDADPPYGKKGFRPSMSFS